MIFFVTVGRKPTEKCCMIFSMTEGRKHSEEHTLKVEKSSRMQTHKKMPGDGSFHPKIWTQVNMNLFICI